MKSILSAVVTLGALSISAQASELQSPLVFSETATTIQGKAIADAKVEMAGYFVPKYKLIPGPKDPKMVSACQFSEDLSNINNDEYFKVLEVTRAADGSYSVRIPVGAQREKCEYVLDSVYMTISDQQLYVPIKFRTVMSVDFGNSLAESDDEKSQVTLLDPSASLSCDFSMAQTSGADCSLKGEPLIYSIEIPGKGETQILDLIDSGKTGE